VQRRERDAGQRGLNCDFGVSLSRISPTMITSGSWRSIEAQAAGEGQLDLRIT